jgi:hypothetical protein
MAVDDPGQRAARPEAADRVTLVSQGTTGDDGAQRLSDAIGVAGADVTGVDVTTSDGTVVHATVANGWWAAWWPGETAPVEVEVHTDDGSTTAAPDDLMGG